MTATNRFFDTNLLLYLFSSSPEKADTVETLLSEGGTISVQVLNEFAAVARRKLQMTFAEISEIADTLTQTLKVVPLTLEIHRRGLQLAERYGYSVYDAMILAAAFGERLQTVTHRRSTTSAACRIHTRHHQSIRPITHTARDEDSTGRTARRRQRL